VLRASRRLDVRSSAKRSSTRSAELAETFTRVEHPMSRSIPPPYDGATIEEASDLASLCV
jgi:hypothetical protein